MRAMRWMVTAGMVVGTIGMGSSAFRAVGPVDRPECPHAFVNDSSVPDSSVPSESSWPTLNVPEINDCQRFIGVQHVRRVYLPGYFAIFAYFDTTSVSTRIATAGGESAVPVAFIYAESVGYAPLSIKQGGNCLYLFAQKRTWTALIKPAVFLADGSRGCEARTRPATGVALPVRRFSPSAAFADYPNASRWDWDPGRKFQYAGVRCDDGWCEVGAVKPSRTHPEYASGTSAKQLRTVEVKGWYDEQYLDHCDVKGCRPTALMGTIMPDSSADAADSAYYAKRFMAVARVAIRVDSSVPVAAVADGDLAVYWAKFHLRPTPNPHQLNDILLCTGTAGECGVPDSVSTKCSALAPALEEVQKGAWWYRVEPSTRESPKYGCYVRRTSMAAAGHVFGAARWRWVLNDATTWTRCAQGCCELQGGS